MRCLLLALSLLAAGPAGAGPADPADLRALELTAGDRESLTAAGFRLDEASGVLTRPDGRPVVESELAGILEKLRADRLRAASARLLELHDLHRRRGAFTPEQASEVRRLLSANADVLPADVQRDFWELAPPAGEGARALDAASERLLRSVAVGGEAASASATGAFDGAARQGAPPVVFAGQDASPPASFTDPDAAFVAEMSGRIDKTEYDAEVKRLLKVIAANAYREDTRTAVEVVEKYKPKIAIGDTDSPNARGMMDWNDGKPEVVVDDKELMLEIRSDRPSKDKNVRAGTLASWNDHQKYLEVFGSVPEVRALHGGEPAWTDEEEDGTKLKWYKGRQGHSAVLEYGVKKKAHILLHELVHVATSGEEAGESSLVTEMRSHLAQMRMAHRMGVKEGGKYEAFQRGFKELEKKMIASYSSNFHLSDMREDGIAHERREIKKKLRMDDENLEAARRAEVAEEVDAYFAGLRELADDLHNLDCIPERDYRKALKRIAEMKEKSVSKEFGKSDTAGYRRALGERLARLDKAEAMYERIIEEDRRWRKQRSR